MSEDKDYDKYCLKAGIENRSTDTLSTFEREAMREKLDADIEQRDYALKTVAALKEENTHLRAMNSRLIEAPASQAPLATTHYEGCWDSGPKHYECALLEVKRLRGESAVAKADYERGLDDGLFLRNKKDGKRPWVGLTDDEKHECYLKVDTWSRCLSAVEDKLREKNGG
tara:strand:- start:443 stop:952 length:510 start_codon:yes stop_codon:yes gene_type:complete